MTFELPELPAQRSTAESLAEILEETLEGVHINRVVRRHSPLVAQFLRSFGQMWHERPLHPDCVGGAGDVVIEVNTEAVDEAWQCVEAGVLRRWPLDLAPDVLRVQEEAERRRADHDRLRPVALAEPARPPGHDAAMSPLAAHAPPARITAPPEPAPVMQAA